MNKTINVIITAILSIGVFAGTITANPQIESIATETKLTEQVALETKSLSEAKLEDKSKTTKPAETLPPRPRTQTAQVSRGAEPSKVVRTPSTTSKTAVSSSSKASAIISTAKKYIGVKYVWGGTTPSGFDCSGFTKYVFAKHGINLPRVSRDQYKVGTSVSKANLRAGDLVFFSLDGDKVIDHVGIYIGNGQFINAASSKGVTTYTMGNYWNSKYIGAKRVL